METKTKEHFERLKSAIHNHLQNIKILKEDYSQKRHLLKIEGYYQNFRIKISEVIDAQKRKYSYYVLKDNYVTAGFDNAADPHVIRQKYGVDFKTHLLENIPHYHGSGKKELKILDKETTYYAFFQWLTENLK